MPTRRIFLQPDEIIEIMSNDGQSCLKLEVRKRKSNNHNIVVLWPQPKVSVAAADITELLENAND